MADVGTAATRHLLMKPVPQRVDCSQFASCKWHGKRIVTKLGIQPKPCPNCGKEVVA